MNFFTWRSAILNSDLASTTKLVLLVISTYMDDHGGGAFPSTETIAKNAGLSQRAVCTHIEKAVAASFITVHKRKQRGRDWALNYYKIAFPPRPGTEPPSAPESDAQKFEGTERGSVPHLQASETLADSGFQGDKNKVLNEVQCPSQGTEPHARGTEPDDTEALNDVQSNSPMNSPMEHHQQQQIGREMFAMHLDWMPQVDRFQGLMQVRGISDEMFSLDALAEFKTFWIGDGRQLRQEQWEHKLLSSLVAYDLRQQRLSKAKEDAMPSNFGEAYARRQLAGGDQ